MFDNQEKQQEAYLAAVEQRMRQELVTLVDTVYETFMASGRSLEEFRIVQFYEHILFSSVNAPEMTPLYRIGGLKLIRLYMKTLIQAYRTQREATATGESYAKT